MSEELKPGRYKILLLAGAALMQDHGFSRWPAVPRSTEGFAAPFEGMVFDGKWDGSSWQCTAPGFGVINSECDSYGNGSLWATGLDAAEVLPEDTHVTDCRTVATPPAVTAKPDLAAPDCPICLDGKLVAQQTHWCDKCGGTVATTEDCKANVRHMNAVAAPVEQASAGYFVQADPGLVMRPFATPAIPPQQAPDPIYLIRPKAGGTTWTECISKQSHDAAMRLGVYESHVVVEVGGQEKAS